MYRGTTPTITINCDIDASEFVTMWVTFRVQKRSTYGQPQEVEITKRLEDEGVDVDGQVISITLTQADTLLLGSLDPEAAVCDGRGQRRHGRHRGDRIPRRQHRAPDVLRCLFRDCILQLRR